MLRGTLLVGLLFGAYSAAGRFSPTSGVLALLIVAAIWPALFRASLHFRLANTSWRGLRLHFNGGVAGAYKAWMPVLLPAAVFVGLSLLAPMAAEKGAAHASGQGGWMGRAMGLAAITAAALLPLQFWSLKRYQHDHYALGRVQSQLRIGPKAFYGLFVKAFGVSILSLAGLAVLGVGAALLFGFGGSIGLGARRGGGAGAVLLLSLLMLAGYVALIVVSSAFIASRLQNLVWNRTKSTQVRFESRLRFAPLLRLTLKNWALVLLTLGLYWPFAAVATARLKLQAVTVYTRRPVDELAGRVAASGQQDAAGDAAGDLFGLDFGF